MTGIPRRQRPTGGERLQNIIPRFSPGSGHGLTGNAGPVNVRSNGARVLLFNATFAVVFHGADGTVTRPDVDLVYWIGAATPSNGIDLDMWYTATI